jgi:hypothetical protein
MRRYENRIAPEIEPADAAFDVLMAVGPCYFWLPGDRCCHHTSGTISDRQANSLLALERSGISDGLQACGVTQPTMSDSLQLEEILGVMRCAARVAVPGLYAGG